MLIHQTNWPATANEIGEKENESNLSLVENNVWNVPNHEKRTRFSKYTTIYYYTNINGKKIRIYNLHLETYHTI